MLTFSGTNKLSAGDDENTDRESIILFVDTKRIAGDEMEKDKAALTSLVLWLISSTVYLVRLQTLLQNHHPLIHFVVVANQSCKVGFKTTKRISGNTTRVSESRLCTSFTEPGLFLLDYRL